MSNAPKWSRDLTKLMNPTAENDWRLLASRLGYSNDDIRGWATQHDPCMALLSEWYATHKTSEASYGVLTALTEMNRMDGVAIVENAMKAAGPYYHLSEQRLQIWIVICITQYLIILHRMAWALFKYVF